MTSVVLASASTDLARRVRIASEDRLSVIQPEHMPVGPAQLMALAPEPESVAVVIMDVRGDHMVLDRALDLASRFEQQHPSIGVMLVSDQAEDLGLRAIRSGVRDVLLPDVSIADIRWALRRVGHVSAGGSGTDVSASPGTYSGRVITVASPKGGVGKTTIATNIARALAEQSPTGTVLIDLDVQFGDVAAALDLESDYTLADLLEGPAMSDPMALKTLLARHGSGLQVAIGVKSPVDADRIKPDRIRGLIEVLKPEFRYIVIDTAPGLTEHTLAAMDLTTDLVLVTGLDVPGVRGLRKELEILDHLNLPPHTRHVVVNNTDRLSGLTIRDVESTIGRKVDLVVPRTASVLRSTNFGTPLVESMPRDKVSKDLVSFVGRFMPVSGQGERSWRRKGQV